MDGGLADTHYIGAQTVSLVRGQIYQASADSVIIIISFDAVIEFAGPLFEANSSWGDGGRVYGSQNT